MANNRAPIDDGHPESDAEYHRRVQDQMDEDSWAGRSTVGAKFPERGIVHEPYDDAAPPHIYKWKRGYGDGH